MQATPESYLANEDYFVIAPALVRQFGVLGLVAEKPSIAQYMVEYNNIMAVPPSLIHQNYYISLMIQNQSDVTVRVTEYRYTARCDNTDTVTADLAAITNQDGFIQYSEVPTAFMNFPELRNVLNNAAFWRDHKPFKPRVRVIRPGKVAAFNTYSKVTFNRADVNRVGDPASPDDGMIRGKTIRAILTYEAENAGYCTTTDQQVTDRLFLRQPQFQLALRVLGHIKSRAIDFMPPMVTGTFTAPGIQSNANAQPVVAATGHELHFANAYSNVNQYTELATTAKQVTNTPAVCAGFAPLVVDPAGGNVTIINDCVNPVRTSECP